VEEIGREVIKMRKVNLSRFEKRLDLSMSQHKEQKRKPGKKGKAHEEMLKGPAISLFRKLVKSFKTQTCCHRKGKNKDIEKLDRISDTIEKRDILKHKRVEGIMLTER
jgi:hypothetical protein